MYVFMYIYICMYVCMHVCMHVCMYACVYVCVYVWCMCVRMCVCMCVRMHLQAYIYIDIRMNFFILTNVPAFDCCADADANARSNARLSARSCVLHQRLSSTCPMTLRPSSLAAAASESPSAFFLQNKFVTKRKNKNKSQRLAKKGVFKSVLLTFFRAVLGNHEKKKREKKNKTLLRRVSKTQSLAMLRVS